MSRITRKLPIRRGFRKPKTHSIVVSEMYAVDALEDEGFNPPNRLKTRGNKDSKIIPAAWNDIVVAAILETPGK